MEIRQKEQGLELNYNGDLAVIQANELVRSKQDDLSLLEAKLVRLAVSQVLKNDQELQTYTCPIVDLAKFLNISKDNIYRDVQELAKTLMKKSIFIKDPDQPTKKGKPNYKIFHWIDFVEYKDGQITFKISDSLKPYLIGLEKLFTRYPLSAVIELPTSYSIRLYELIASYENIKWRHLPSVPYTHDIRVAPDEFYFTVDWLRDYFNCQDKYKNASDFTKRVINSSVEAINENTYMKVDYRIVKAGRSISHIVFKLRERPALETTDELLQRLEKRYNSDV